MCFNCFQAYSTTEKGKKSRETFYKHTHFCFSINHAINFDTIYTKIVVCKHTLPQLMKKHKAVMLF